MKYLIFFFFLLFLFKLLIIIKKFLYILELWIICTDTLWINKLNYIILYDYIKYRLTNYSFNRTIGNIPRNIVIMKKEKVKGK